MAPLIIQKTPKTTQKQNDAFITASRLVSNAHGDAQKSFDGSLFRNDGQKAVAQALLTSLVYPRPFSKYPSIPPHWVCTSSNEALRYSPFEPRTSCGIDGPPPSATKWSM